MSHHDHHAHDPAAGKAGESLLDMLGRFFPGRGEVSAFVGGVVFGVLILGLLVALALPIGGLRGIWRTF